MNENELIREIGKVQPILFFLWKEMDYTEPELLYEVKLNLSQIFALEIIGRNKIIIMSELAEVMHAKSSTATKIIDCLVNRGLVKRARASDDRRVVKIYLTDTGKDLVEKMEQRRNEHLLAYLKLLDDENQKKLIEVFKAWESAINKKEVLTTKTTR